MSGRQYDLPGGAVGHEFVDLLTTEVQLLTDNSAISATHGDVEVKQF